jgi:hypothetical protein
MHPEDWQTVQRFLLVHCVKNCPIASLFSSFQRSGNFANKDGYLLTLDNGFYELSRLHLCNKNGATVLNSVKDTEKEAIKIIIPCHELTQLVQSINALQIDAVIIFTSPFQSPFSIAYLCYMAGVSIRVGQSNEFGGGILSSAIAPPLEISASIYSHVLKSAGLATNVD